MKNKLIASSLEPQKAKINELVRQLHDLTRDIGHQELSKTLEDIRARMTEPFMFVIVGEVKAGKSSFINALLDTGDEICAVAPSPMTDTIQQIVYGQKTEVVDINPYLKRIYQPIELLRDISIVDTPGTNTIIKHHQEITENFIPASDLIVFVFEAKNPYRQSAWEFFDYIHHDWRRKIIFVLQQKDLMNQEDLKINEEGVRKFAIEKGIENPIIFSVSAKQELEKKREQSGFLPLRNYIAEHITGGQAPLLKLQNNIQTAENVLERIESGISDRVKQHQLDTNFREDVRKALNNQQDLSYRQIDILVENVIAGYNKTTRESRNELENGLSLGSLLKRTFGGIFSKKQSAKEWFEGLTKDLENKLNAEMANKLNTGIADLADSIQQMARIIDLKLQSSSSVLKNDHEVFSQIAVHRSRVLSDLRKTFDEFIRDPKNFKKESYLNDYKDLSPNIATGGGIAIVGVILQALSTTTVLDITGGVLTAIGIVFAGVSIGWNRKKILSGFDKVIQTGAEKLQAVLSEKLQNYTDEIRGRFESNFDRFDQMLLQEKQDIEKLTQRAKSLRTQIQTVKTELGQNTN